MTDSNDAAEQVQVPIEALTRLIGELYVERAILRGQLTEATHQRDALVEAVKAGQAFTGATADAAEVVPINRAARRRQRR